MNYPEDTEKLNRVRERMKERGIDALVVRAPDNVLYLTNYWPMKGYSMAIFPSEGETTLHVVEPQLSDTRETVWTDRTPTFPPYDPNDPRPPYVRSRKRAIQTLKDRNLDGTVGIELTQSVQLHDRMVGEPTVYYEDYFKDFREAADEVVDATALLGELRMIKTEQELKRMRFANDLASEALEHARDNLEPETMKESDVAAMLEGYVSNHGIGYDDRIQMARGFAIVWSGEGIATFTQTHDNPISTNEPTLCEFWCGIDGYWTDLTRNLVPGDNPKDEYCDLLDTLLEIQENGARYARPGASMPELDRMMREQIAEAGYPGQPSHPVVHGIGARIHEAPWPHQEGTGTLRENMVLSIEPGVYWEGGGGLRVEDSYLVKEDETEKLCPFPDDFRR